MEWQGVKQPVLNKTSFVRRYQAGEFGNAAPTWDGLHQCLASGYTGLVHIRNRNRGAATWYNVSTVPQQALRDAWSHATAQYPAGQLYISAMAPTGHTLFQGEVQQGYHGLDLYYTTVAQPMRQALATSSRQVCGIMASWLIRYYLCPNSHVWLMHLLESYPYHVVEFSTYGVRWGTLPGFNTVFWEVRLY